MCLTITAVLGLPSDRRVQGRNGAGLTEQADLNTDPWMPVTHRQYAGCFRGFALDKLACCMNTAPIKKLKNRSSEQVAELPAALGVYKSSVQSLGTHQAAAPKSAIFPMQSVRLEALGYTTCKSRLQKPIWLRDLDHLRKQELEVLQLSGQRRVQQ